MNTWLLLHYKLPAKPSALRVVIWRKLKRLGAVYHLASIWILPDRPRTLEQFRWISAEIVELGGKAGLWRSESLQGESEETLISRFDEQVRPGYQALLAKLQGGGIDLPSASSRYQYLKSKDYFNAEAGRCVRDALLSARGGYS